MAFTVGTGTFTNGSATVTSVSLSSGTLAYFASGTRMIIGANPVTAEVEAVAAPTVTTITLRSPWPHTGGTYNFLANQTSEGLRDAVQSIRNNNTTLQNYIDSVSKAPNADTVLERTSTGAARVADAQNADEAVALGQTGTAYSKDVGESSGNVMGVGAGGWLGNAKDVSSIPNGDLDQLSKTGVYDVSSGVLNIPPQSAFGVGTVLHIQGNSQGIGSFQIFNDDTGAPNVYIRRKNVGWGLWQKLFHQDNILGAVSQSGGVPTGAIIERGSNANGDYVKFADGTMICTKELDLSASSDTTWTFPSSFITDVNLAISGVCNALDRVITTGATPPSTTATTIRGWTIPTASRSATTSLLQAIGRWY